MARKPKASVALDDPPKRMPVGYVTAAECNEWLATLPPAPLWPDRCACPLCNPKGFPS